MIGEQEIKLKNILQILFLALAAKPQQVTKNQPRKHIPLNFAPPFGSTDHVKKPRRRLVLQSRVGGNHRALVSAKLLLFPH